MIGNESASDLEYTRDPNAEDSHFRDLGITAAAPGRPRLVAHPISEEMSDADQRSNQGVSPRPRPGPNSEREELEAPSEGPARRAQRRPDGDRLRRRVDRE